MKVDLQMLLIVVVLGVISAGLVAATVVNNDPTMKQEVFDGIKISVPVDSNFVKTGDGVYKDDNYGITIHTFDNKDSMVQFLKNSKKAKVISLENQPPQSVAYKSGDVVSLLVTNGKQGVDISTKDPKLTAEIGNNIVFSNNHKSAKSSGVGIVQPPMSQETDFNFITVIVADVDNKVFNAQIFNNYTLSVVEEYNANITGPIDIIVPDNDDNSTTVSEAVENDDLSDVVDSDSNSASDNSNDRPANQASNSATPADSDTVEQISSDGPSSSPSEPSTTSEVASSSPSSSSSSSAAASSSPSSSSSSSGPSSSSPGPSSGGSSSAQNSQSKLTAQDCMKIIQKEFPNYQIDGTPTDKGNSYIFKVRGQGNKMGSIEISKIDGSVVNKNLP